jgi:hypothetical protein
MNAHLQAAAADFAALETENSALRERIRALEAENAALRERCRALEAIEQVLATRGGAYVAPSPPPLSKEEKAAAKAAEKEAAKAAKAAIKEEKAAARATKAAEKEAAKAAIKQEKAAAKAFIAEVKAAEKAREVAIKAAEKEARAAAKAVKATVAKRADSPTPPSRDDLVLTSISGDLYLVGNRYVYDYDMLSDTSGAFCGYLSADGTTIVDHL